MKNDNSNSSVFTIDTLVTIISDDESKIMYLLEVAEKYLSYMKEVIIDDYSR